MPIYTAGEYHQNNFGIDSRGNEPQEVFLAKMQLLDALFKTSEFRNSPVAQHVVSIAMMYADPKIRDAKVESYLQTVMQNAYRFDSPISERQYTEAREMWNKFKGLEPRYKEIQALAPKIKEIQAEAKNIRPNNIISRIIEICSFTPDVTQWSSEIALYLYRVSEQVARGNVHKEEYEEAKLFGEKIKESKNSSSSYQEGRSPDQELEEMIDNLRNAERLPLSFEELGRLCSFGKSPNQSFASFEVGDNPFVSALADKLNAVSIWSPGLEEVYITQLLAIQADRFPIDCFTSVLSGGKLNARDLQAIKNVIERRLIDPKSYYNLHGVSSSVPIGDIEEALNHSALTPAQLQAMLMLVDSEMSKLTSDIDRTSSFGKS